MSSSMDQSQLQSQTAKSRGKSSKFLVLQYATLSFNTSTATFAVGKSILRTIAMPKPWKFICFKQFKTAELRVCSTVILMTQPVFCESWLDLSTECENKLNEKGQNNLLTVFLLISDLHCAQCTPTNHALEHRTPKRISHVPFKKKAANWHGHWQLLLNLLNNSPWHPYKPYDSAQMSVFQPQLSRHTTNPLVKHCYNTYNSPFQEIILLTHEYKCSEKH